MTLKLFSSLEPRENWSDYFQKNEGLIVDLGCGYGADSYYLAKQGYHVIAVDEENHLRFEHPNLVFSKQKIESLIEKKFDGVIANFSLHFLNPVDRLKTIKHYINSLNSDGVFYILIFNKFITPAFLSIFPHEPIIEYSTTEDDHPPEGKHVHRVAKIIYKNKS